MPTERSPQAQKLQSTKPLCNRIAIVFDFDDTLGADSFDELLRRLDIEIDQFRQQLCPTLDQSRMGQGCCPFLLSDSRIASTFRC